MSCIYGIINTVSSKIYVGKALSFEERKKEHLRKLRYGKHVNNYLQHAYNKHGESVFEFVILGEYPEPELNEKEIYWIGYHNSVDSFWGYNLKYGGQGGTSTKEARQKLSLRQDVNKKPVYGFSTSGELVKTWDSIKACSKDLHRNPCDIRRTIKEEQYSCAGYILQDSEVFTPRLTPSDKVKLRSRDHAGKFIQLSKI